MWDRSLANEIILRGGHEAGAENVNTPRVSSLAANWMVETVSRSLIVLSCAGSRRSRGGTRFDNEAMKTVLAIMRSRRSAPRGISPPRTTMMNEPRLELILAPPIKCCPALFELYAAVPPAPRQAARPAPGRASKRRKSARLSRKMRSRPDPPHVRRRFRS